MPLLPDVAQMERVQSECTALFDRGECLGAMEISTHLMALEDMPMHNPVHHFLFPAALLTAAHLRAGSSRDRFLGDLAKAKERSKDIPGGICGLHGCCGAAVGAGIFTSIWLGANPLSQGSWAAANRVTAAALSAIAGVDGPRCCKRCGYLAFRGALPVIEELTGLDLGKREIRCVFHKRSRECKKEMCPFYPAGV